MRLKVEKVLGVKNLLLQSNSMLVIGQIKGSLKQRREGCKNTQNPKGRVCKSSLERESKNPILFLETQIKN